MAVEHFRTSCLANGVMQDRTLSSHLGSQPQGDVGWLRRLPHHPHQIVAKGVWVCFVAQLGRGALKSLPRDVLPSHVFNNSLEVAYELGLASSMCMFQGRVYSSGIGGSPATDMLNRVSLRS